MKITWAFLVNNNRKSQATSVLNSLSLSCFSSKLQNIRSLVISELLD